MKMRHRPSLTVAGSIMLLALLLGISLHLFLPHPSARASSRLARIVIMPLGDSITFGIGSSNDNGYRLALWQELTAAGFKVSFVGSLHAGSKFFTESANEGHSGWRIEQISTHIVSWLKMYRPNYILLHIGTNDILHQDDPRDAPARLKWLLDQITNTLPGVTVLVAQITPLAPRFEPQVEAFNRAIPDIVRQEVAAGKHVKYVDIHDAVPFRDLWDTVHPNNAGYALMAKAWYRALYPLLKLYMLPTTLNKGSRILKTHIIAYQNTGSANNNSCPRYAGVLMHTGVVFICEIYRAG